MKTYRVIVEIKAHSEADAQYARDDLAMEMEDYWDSGMAPDGTAISVGDVEPV